MLNVRMDVHRVLNYVGGGVIHHVIVIVLVIVIIDVSIHVQDHVQHI